jgi:hypothetical protein
MVVDVAFRVWCVNGVHWKDILMKDGGERAAQCQQDPQYITDELLRTVNLVLLRSTPFSKATILNKGPAEGRDDSRNFF